MRARTLWATLQALTPYDEQNHCKSHKPAGEDSVVAMSDTTQGHKRGCRLLAETSTSQDLPFKVDKYVFTL